MKVSYAGIFLTAVMLAAALPLHAEISLGGALRNDFLVMKPTNNQANFNNTLELKLVFTRAAEEWKFYADARISLYAGLITNITQTDLGLNLLRAFIRYYSPAGVITLGKTYMNFGIRGMFNPFEMVKNVNFTDLNYDLEGMIALTWELGFDELSGLKTYVRPDPALSNSGGGLALYTHLGTFDLGAIYNRKAYDRNVAGVYFKGDIELGVNGAWAYHFDDYGTNRFNEANLGLDYSFFDGKLILALVFYFDETGAENSSSYNPFSTVDKYFKAKYYSYANISVVFDEFFSMQADGFFNMIDGSGLAMPQVKYTLSDGLSVGALAGIPWGPDKSEFSPNTSGEFSILGRFEAKL
ncbi:MAG: hypothetical protein A2Y33_10795 [Spirochaetes bacterium GWF1_51_8]|nr:MAG: hypothetical protein A2Y33_10795 [Spirochaetes bacterium GWF1_51_8]